MRPNGGVESLFRGLSRLSRQMKIYTSDHFVLPLPEGHRFPMRKYRDLRRAVADSDFASAVELLVPDPATDEEILRVHEAAYLERVKSGTLSVREVRRIGFPWSRQMVERSRRSVGGTLGACRAALADGVAVNLAGGTHHAFSGHGQGFCVLNDVAIAARAMQEEGGAKRLLVVDCDVHQGDGTAALFHQDPSVFTFSVHGRRNFPFQKQVSDLDVALEDGTGDGDYLRAVVAGLGHSLARAGADLAVYLAGADPYLDDRLGRLAVSRAGLEERDRLVLGACRDAGLPVAVVMAGGYARRVEDVVAIHLATVRAAVEAARGSLKRQYRE